MPHRITAVLLLLFLATIGVNWPALPFNASIADVIFLPLAIAVAAIGIPRWSWHRADWAIVLYLVGAVPAIAVSTDRPQSLIELSRELYLVAIYIVIATAARQGFAKTIGKGLALGGALLSIAGLVFVALNFLGITMWAPMGEVMQLPYLGATLRLRAMTASEAMFACVLTAAAPFAIVACRADRVRAWCIAAAVMCAAVALTFSHAVAGFTAASVIAIWPSLGRWSRRLAATAAIVIAIGLNFAATASIKAIDYGRSSYADATQYHYAIEERRMQLGAATITYNVMSYARIKQVAWRTFLEHPLAGIGLDRFHVATERAYQQGSLTESYREIDPHSTVIGRFAECGLIGGATLLLLLIAWAVMASDVARQSTIGYAAAAALAGLLLSSLNADIMNFRFLWVIAGLMRGLHDASGMVIDSGRDATVTAGTD